MAGQDQAEGHHRAPLFAKFGLTIYRKDVEDAISENDATKAKDIFISTQKVLDKLANKKVLPKNAVARQKKQTVLRKVLEQQNLSTVWIYSLFGC